MERRAPLPGNRFRFRVRACRACGRGEAAWAGERKSPAAEARPDQMTLRPASGGARCPAGVPLSGVWGGAVSRRCPVGVPSVSRRCPAGVPSGGESNPGNPLETRNPGGQTRKDFVRETRNSSAKPGIPARPRNPESGGAKPGIPRPRNPEFLEGAENGNSFAATAARGKVLGGGGRFWDGGAGKGGEGGVRNLPPLWVNQRRALDDADDDQATTTTTAPKRQDLPP